MDFRAPENADAPDCWTRYHGKKQRVAVFYLGGKRVAIGLSDTYRCADSIESCRTVLSSLADEHDLPGDPSMCATQLRLLCQQITRWKEKPKRDRPMRQPRRMYL